MSPTLICDFCSSPDVRWRYPAHDFEIPHFSAASLGSWAACDICHGLIDANNWSGLLKRSIATCRLKFPEMQDRIADLHSMFRNARFGPAQPYREPE